MRVRWKQSHAKQWCTECESESPCRNLITVCTLPPAKLFAFHMLDILIIYSVSAFAPQSSAYKQGQNPHFTWCTTDITYNSTWYKNTSIFKAASIPDVRPIESSRFLAAGPTCLLRSIHQHTPDGTERISPDVAMELCQSESQEIYQIHLRPSSTWPRSAALQDRSLGWATSKWEIKLSWPLYITH